jgi:hypothetical protein
MHGAPTPTQLHQGVPAGRLHLRRVCELSSSEAIQNGMFGADVHDLRAAPRGAPDSAIRTPALWISLNAPLWMLAVTIVTAAVVRCFGHEPSVGSQDGQHRCSAKGCAARRELRPGHDPHRFVRSIVPAVIRTYARNIA